MKHSQLFVRCGTESTSHFPEGFLRLSVFNVFLSVYAEFRCIIFEGTCLVSWMFKKINEQKILSKKIGQEIKTWQKDCKVDSLK